MDFKFAVPEGFNPTRSKETPKTPEEIAEIEKRNREFRESKSNPANWGPPTYGFFASEEQQPDESNVSIET